MLRSTCTAAGATRRCSSTSTATASRGQSKGPPAPQQRMALTCSCLRRLQGHVEPAVGGPSAAFLPSLLAGGLKPPSSLLWDAPAGLFHLMEEEGLPVYKGEPIFDGGFISRHYSGAHGIDSIQFEFHHDLRQTIPVAEDSGRRLGRTLAAFLKRHGRLL